MPVKSLAVFRIVSPKPLLQLVLYLLLFSTAAVPKGQLRKEAKLIDQKVSKGFTPKEKIAYNTIVGCIQRRYKSDAQETFEKYDKDNDGIASVGEILRFFEDCSWTHTLKGNVGLKEL